MALGSAPMRQSVAMNSGLSPMLSAIFFHSVRELAGLHHQHAVAGVERVDQRRLPGAGAGGGVDDHRIGGLEDGLDAVEAAPGELLELRPAVVDDRRVHRPQDAVRQRRRPRNVQEMAADGARGILEALAYLAGLSETGSGIAGADAANVARRAACRHEGRMRWSVKSLWRVVSLRNAKCAETRATCPTSNAACAPN